MPDYCHVIQFDNATYNGEPCPFLGVFRIAALQENAKLHALTRLTFGEFIEECFTNPDSPRLWGGVIAELKREEPSCIRLFVDAAKI